MGVGRDKNLLLRDFSLGWCVANEFGLKCVHIRVILLYIKNFSLPYAIGRAFLWHFINYLKLPAVMSLYPLKSRL